MGIKCTDYDYSKYNGCVLSFMEHNTYHDSDWYATVWDEETQSVKSDILYQTTRSGMYGSCEIDATEEIRQKAAITYAKQDFINKINSKSVCGDRTVKVVKGRKVPKGIIGEVIQIKPNDYQSWNRRIEIETADGTKYWTYEDNLECLPFSEEDKELIYYQCVKSNQKRFSCKDNISFYFADMIDDDSEISEHYGIYSHGDVPHKVFEKMLDAEKEAVKMNIERFRAGLAI